MRCYAMGGEAGVNPTNTALRGSSVVARQLFVRQAADYKGRIGGITKEGIPGITTEIMSGGE